MGILLTLLLLLLRSRLASARHASAMRSSSRGRSVFVLEDRVVMADAKPRASSEARRFNATPPGLALTPVSSSNTDKVCLSPKDSMILTTMLSLARPK